MSNPITKFVENGQSLTTTEGMKLILASNIEEIGDAALDSETILDQLLEVADRRQSDSTKMDFDLTAKFIDIHSYLEHEYLRRKRLEAFRSLSLQQL
jgi:hypothetical protein